MGEGMLADQADYQEYLHHDVRVNGGLGKVKRSGISVRFG